MYLAYQAKAKETELLEANLQRKANRKISGKKYGFQISLYNNKYSKILFCSFELKFTFL